MPSMQRGQMLECGNSAHFQLVGIHMMQFAFFKKDGEAEADLCGASEGEEGRRGNACVHAI